MWLKCEFHTPDPEVWQFGDSNQKFHFSFCCKAKQHLAKAFPCWCSTPQQAHRWHSPLTWKVKPDLCHNQYWFVQLQHGWFIFFAEFPQSVCFPKNRVHADHRTERTWRNLDGFIHRHKKWFRSSTNHEQVAKACWFICWARRSFCRSFCWSNPSNQEVEAKLVACCSPTKHFLPQNK